MRKSTVLELRTRVRVMFSHLDTLLTVKLRLVFAVLSLMLKTVKGSRAPEEMLI